MKEIILKALEKSYPVHEENVGPYAVLKKSGMTFRISAYTIEGFGAVSFIDMNAMLGLMRMESFILTAKERDLPLFSGDYIKAAGKHTLLVEFYDTMLQPLDAESVADYRSVKAAYADLPPYETEARWYDNIRYDFTLAATDKRLQKQKEDIVRAYYNAYEKNILRAASCDPAEKVAKTAAYVDGLFSNGGPAVNQFKKLFGETAAREIFEKYVFSCR